MVASSRVWFPATGVFHVRSRSAVAVAVMLGRYAPRAMPSAAALALAFAHDSRVSGLLHNARSTASASLSGSGTLGADGHAPAGPFQNWLGSAGRNLAVSKGSVRSAAAAAAKHSASMAAARAAPGRLCGRKRSDDV